MKYSWHRSDQRTLSLVPLNLGANMVAANMGTTFVRTEWTHLTRCSHQILIRSLSITKRSRSTLPLIDTDTTRRCYHFETQRSELQNRNDSVWYAAARPGLKWTDAELGRRPYLYRG